MDYCWQRNGFVELPLSPTQLAWSSHNVLSGHKRVGCAQSESTYCCGAEGFFSFYIVMPLPCGMFGFIWSICGEVKTNNSCCVLGDAATVKAPTYDALHVRVVLQRPLPSAFPFCHSPVWNGSLVMQMPEQTWFR